MMFDMLMTKDRKMRTRTLEENSHYRGALAGRVSTASTQPKHPRFKKSLPAHLIVLHDGRRLAYAEYGDKTGFPLFYFHNHAGSRIEGQFFHRDAQHAGFRIIAVDRPGVGFSDSVRAMSHKSFSDDVVELADSLGLPRFGLLSWAGGSPFAFAAAHQHPERIKLLISLCSVPMQPQPDYPGRSLMGTLSRLSLAAMKMFIGIRQLSSTRNAQQYLQRLSDAMCFADRKIIQNPAVLKVMTQGIEESRRQGGFSLASDSRLCFEPWDFALEDIKVPVQLWHGTADTLVPPHYATVLAQDLGDCVLRKVAHRGHLFFMQSAEEVFALANSRICADREAAANTFMPVQRSSTLSSLDSRSDSLSADRPVTALRSRMGL
jgi:pimeloyl-ACP methyl ester carboxylesterase